MKKITTYLVTAVLCAGALLSCTKEEPASMSLLQSEIEADYGGLTTTIGVKCNRDWSASCDAEWVTMSHASEEAFEAYSYILVTVDAIGDNPERTATVTITSKDGTLTQLVKIKQGADPEVIRSAEKFVEYLNKVNDGKAGDNYRLGADIDLSGVTLPAVAELSTRFNGQGYKIKNWTSSSSLFGNVTSTSEVKNIVFENCTLTFPEAAGNFGFVAKTSAAPISNISFSGTASVKVANNGYKGIVVGEATASITACETSVNVTYSGEAPAGGSMYFGAVAGRINNSAAVISGCKNHGNISFTYSSVLSQSSYVAGIAGAVNNNGKILNCTNEGSVKIVCPGSGTNNMAGGIVCYAGGEVSSCSNSGSITLYAESADGKADGPLKGTGVSGVACYMGWANGTMKGCSNSGDITLRGGYSIGFQQVGSATKYSTNVGGVVGHACNCGLEDCHNTGNVTSMLKNIDNVAANYNTSVRQSVGGVISSSWGKIVNCSNKGTVTAEWVTSTHNATLAKNCVCQAGGVNGGDYHSAQTSSPMENCTNEGAVNITCDSSGSNNAFGGVVGWATKEALTGSEFSGCVNKGTVTVQGFTKCRVAGIVGAGGKLTSCTNYGKIYYKSGLTNSAVGGVAGLANFLNYDGCANYGDVVSDVKIAGTSSSCVGVGGLVGGAGNTVMTFTNCKVKCNMTCEGCTSMAMIVGSIGHNKSGGKAFTIGTAEKPIKVSGSFNGTTLTSANYQSFITSSVYNPSLNTNVTMVAQYGE